MLLCGLKKIECIAVVAVSAFVAVRVAELGSLSSVRDGTSMKTKTLRWLSDEPMHPSFVSVYIESHGQFSTLPAHEKRQSTSQCFGLRAQSAPLFSKSCIWIPR